MSPCDLVPIIWVVGMFVAWFITKILKEMRMMEDADDPVTFMFCLFWPATLVCLVLYFLYRGVNAVMNNGSKAIAVRIQKR